MASVKEEENFDQSIAEENSNNKQPGNSLAELEEQLRREREKIRILEEGKKTSDEEKKRLEKENKKLQKKAKGKDEIPYYTESEITDLKPLRKIVYTGKLQKWGQIAAKQLEGNLLEIDYNELANIIKLDQHPNIVRLYGILWDGQVKTNCRGYVMEYLEKRQTLSEVIYDKARIYELPQMCQWIEEIACGLQFLHDETIFYRNLKPENILLIVGNQLKLSDSGMGRTVDSITSIETLCYVAPEILRREHFNGSSDIYSLAVTTWEIFHRKKPYSKLGEMSKYVFIKKIVAEKMRPTIDETKMDEEIAELIKNCWQASPSSRPELKEIVNVFKERASTFKPKDVPHYKQSDFNLTETLGNGQYGSVSKTEDRYNRIVAVKIFYNNTGSVDEKYCDREVQILKKHVHPNIVELLGVVWNGTMLQDGKGRLYDGYVMEYMELGSLDKEIYDLSKSYDLKLVVKWIHQISEGLYYLHSEDIIHRDIKPKNILLAARDHLKLADFGIARYSSTQNTNSYGLSVGTEVYRAPEVLNSSNYGPAADVYPLGVTIWEIMHRKTPREDMKRDSQEEIIVDIPEEPRELEVLTDLVKGCLKEDPNDRSTLSDIFDYLFNKGFCQTILIIDLPHIVVLNADQSKWIELRMDIPRRNYCRVAVYLNGEIHRVGCGEECKSLYKLDRNSLKWQQLADMNVGRRFIRNTCLVLDGYIWVLGGSDAGRFLKSVERYDPETDKWTLMPEMKYPREWAAAAVWNNQIIISGGLTDDGLTDTVECFNPKDGSWTELPNMPKRLAYHSLVSYKNKIILMGGKDEKWEMQTDVYELDPDEGNPAWKPRPPMKYPAYFISGVVLDDEIYAFESDALLILNRVEIFNGQQWRDGPTVDQPLSAIHPVIISQHLANRLCNYK